MLVKQRALKLAQEQREINPAVMAAHDFDPDDPQTMFERMYFQARAAVRAPPVFRPGAGAVLSALVDAYGRENVTFLTNSGTEQVAKKLARLARTEAERGNRVLVDQPVPIIGDARRYVITPGDPAEIPSTMQLVGLARPVQLHRGHYARVLRPIAQRIGGADRVTVIGDSFELDLATPLALDFRGVLFRTENTGAPELAYMRSRRATRRHVVHGYPELRRLLDL
jgi:FMN phosphatase YigB (HAD superfamily)